MKQGALFLAMPRSLHDLRRPLSMEKHHYYEVEKTVDIPRGEYENFTEDMVQWRQFIEDNTHLCRVDDDGVWHCILVRAKGQQDGVLIMSDGEYWTKYAAYYSGKPKDS